MGVICTTIAMINTAEVRQPVEGEGLYCRRCVHSAADVSNGLLQTVPATRFDVLCLATLPRCMLLSACPTARSDMHYTSDPRCAG